MSILILKPNDVYETYTQAANVFCDFCEKTTSLKLPISENDDGVSDLVVIGSDSVNDFLMNEVLDLNIRSFGIRYGTDDYCIKTYKKDGRRVLVLAGGRGRSTLYAVYDYFERFCNCSYFWDGDILPKCDKLVMENIDIIESPRFFYRGLRYFAHRGLKRFQAEHWSFEDWKQELDWMVKKRLNFFMLRIGMDDVWHRAFPEDVKYPKEYRIIKGKDANGFDDRSDFWTLKYKGDLKAKVLEYARKLDLMYPTDCGTMTHWYSRTPVEFLENKKPGFINQDVQMYSSTDTGKVFDFTKKENMDYYMHLTETMVDQYEKSTSLFHTIGLGERRLYTDKDKNFALKLIAYRRILENIKRRYPDSKLMLASWDFCGHWTPEEAATLFKELDPESTILLDYTSDMNDPDYSFLNWDIIGKFPYIFGIFHAYEAESELRGPYHRTDERLKIAADDPFCKGMILWPELAHSDPIILEYLSQNSWAPLEKSVEEITSNFCKKRYGRYAEVMNKSWQNILPFIKLGEWGGEGHARPIEDKGDEMCQSAYMHMDVWARLCSYVGGSATREDIRKYFSLKERKSRQLSQNIIDSLTALTEEPEALENPYILRDSIDIVRTVIGRFLNYTVNNALRCCDDKEKVKSLKKQYMELLDILADVLSLNDDFSIYHTLNELKKVAPTNPDFEITLKRNVCNWYCVQPIVELINYVFKAEGEVVFGRIIDETMDKKEDWNFEKEHADIVDNFMAIPLKSMQPTKVQSAKEVLEKATDYIKKILK